MKELAIEMLINMSKNAMINNINSLPKDRLEYELRNTLQEKWELEERIDKAIEYIEEHIKGTFRGDINTIKEILKGDING